MQATDTTNRLYLSNDLDFTSWPPLQPYFEELERRKINSLKELEQWLKDSDELRDAFEERYTRIYIRFTTHTNDKEASDAYNEFLNEIVPPFSEWDNKLNQKLLQSPFTPQLNQTNFFPTLRELQKKTERFRHENLELAGREGVLQNEFNTLKSLQRVEHNGKSISREDALTLLNNADRNFRKEVFGKIVACTLKDTEELDRILTELITLRNRIAKNAGYPSFVPYKYEEWGRFDFTDAQMRIFDEIIATVVAPHFVEFDRKRAQYLNVEVLQIYDGHVRLSEAPPLQPSKNSEDLIEKTIECLNRLDPYFGDGIKKIRALGQLDIEPSNTKAVNIGYNAGLPETKVPYIMLNNRNTPLSLENLIHECGHAVHTLLSTDLQYSFFRNLTPLEMNEIASKAMELMSMDHWDIFYPDPVDLKAAKKHKLSAILSDIALFSKTESFEMWLYENPAHTLEERHAKWTEVSNKFRKGLYNNTGYEQYVSIGYQNMPAVYAHPFYMVAYSLTELGALAIWRNYKKDPAKTIQQYKDALSLGNTRTLPELYKTAGIEFDFSEGYVKELVGFLMEELEKLED